MKNSDNPIQKKSYSFSLDMVNLYKLLVSENKEYILSKQLIRSGTSIGANVEEAIGGITKRDFTAKMSIAYKEARESHYWLRILRDTEYITSQTACTLLLKCEELLKILGSIIKSAKGNSNKY